METQESQFITWHRPYLLLFEQELVKIAQDLAKKYPAKYRDEYTKAANSLRAPYWDWAADSRVPPASVAAQITVNIPDGQGIKQSNIDNPLYTYKFTQATLNGRYGGFDSSKPQTYRCTSPNNYPGSANARLQGRSYRQNVVSIYRILFPSRFVLVKSDALSFVDFQSLTRWCVVRCLHLFQQLFSVPVHRKWWRGP